MTDKKHVNIIGCGGTGVNIVDELGSVSKASKGMPNVTRIIIDSCIANINSNDTDVQRYIIPGMEGAGSNRGFCFDQAAGHVTAILQKYKPADYNILIFSTSGGTGSVMGPLLVKELLSRGSNVIILVVTSSESSKGVENTINTINTLRKISINVKKPVIATFNHNTSTQSREMINRQIVEQLKCLVLLLSGQTSELDRQDITNWLSYNAILPNIPPQLTELSIAAVKTNEVPKFENTVLAVIQLLVSKVSPPLDLKQAYNKTGYLHASLVNNAEEPLPNCYFVLHIDYITQMVSTFEAMNEKAKQNEAAIMLTSQANLAGLDTSKEFDF
jgi:hypothetical protein